MASRSIKPALASPSSSLQDTMQRFGPCTKPDSSAFISWFRGHLITQTDNWIFLDDFNFYRSISDHSRPRGNIQDTLVFNEAIGHLGLIELPLKGRAFTWSNMQTEPLLEQLDWFFTIVNWTVDFPNTQVIPMAKITSDHIPCKVVIDTKIPKAKIFRFENFWPEMSGFLEVVSETWSQTPSLANATSTLSIKFKKLRYSLKQWSKNFSDMKVLIANCNSVILFMDTLEEIRPLFNPESNLRSIIQLQLAALLRSKTRTGGIGTQKTGSSLGMSVPSSSMPWPLLLSEEIPSPN